MQFRVSWLNQVLAICEEDYWDVGSTGDASGFFGVFS
jgi:hypothetical protein